jgi:Fe-S cluster assembly scaffold protein SufB
MVANTQEVQAGPGDGYRYGFAMPENYTFKSRKGLDEQVVREISYLKSEPPWMTNFRVRALKTFEGKPMPQWGGWLNDIDFNDIFYFVRASDTNAGSWDDVPAEVKNTFDRLGIPEAEKKYLAGVGAQYESEVVYHSLREDLSKLGVIFTDMDTAVRDYPDLVKEYFSTIIPTGDNKFAALNSAVWSGGSFVYVPSGVSVEVPLQAYFRINAQNMGQFERTLIIAEPGSYVHYVEGCTAPTYTTNSLHSAVVEIIVKEGARVRYTTIQNWSHNVYNLVTKRAAAYRDATMEWVDGNLGCLAEGSTVTTPEGVKAIEDVQVGEQVLSYDEASGELCFRTVRAKRFSGHQPVHTVKLGGRQLRATANHPFYSYTYNPQNARKSGRYELGYVRADQLSKAIVPKGSIEYGKPHPLSLPRLETLFQSSNQHTEFEASRTLASRIAVPEHTTDDLMWLFGYWVGDGDMEIKIGKTEEVVRYARVGFSTPAADRARDRLVGTMSAVLEREPEQRSDGLHLRWSSKELAAFFELNGFYGNAHTKRVPSWVWSLPQSQRIAFIAGYLDADGSVPRGRRGFSLKSCNRALLDDVASLLVTLGLTPRLRAEFTEPRETTIMGVTCVAKGSYRLEFPLDSRFFEHISPSLRAQAEAVRAAATRHKRLVGRSSLHLPESVEIAKVEVSEASPVVVPTWDIEVEGTGNFVSQGFIVHNSKLTMKYPAVWLMEPGARGDVLSVAFAGSGQHQDAGAKMVHKAPHTTSNVVSKSISKGTGRATYRGLLEVAEDAHHCKANVKCDALLLDEDARSDTYPTINVANNSTTIQHEATVSKVGEDQLFYLMSRGISENEATAMVVNGFVEPITKEIPLEYAVELNRLIELQMEGSIG